MEPSWNCRGSVVALLQAQLVRYLHEAGEPPASAVARAAVAAATAASAAASAASAAAGSRVDASAPLDVSSYTRERDASFGADAPLEALLAVIPCLGDV